MRVKVHPADQGGCGHYRLIWPAQALTNQGGDVEISAGLPAIWRDDNTGQAELVGIGPVDADVVVLQRPLQHHLADAIPLLQDQGVAVVVEVDDDFSCIPPANPAYGHAHPHTNPDRNWNHLARACQLADLVTVTTPALARRYGHHGRVRVVPNCVPARYLDITAPPFEQTVGWSGSVDTHPGDLEVTRGAVGRAAAACGLTVRVVGTGRGVPEALDVTGVEASGWLPIRQYPEQLAHLGIGIVPLAATAFNQAKSSLKMCELAAVGVPCVVSPSADNRRVNGEGIGLIAERPREWERAIRTLASSESMRSEMAGVGRDVMRRHTIEGNADRWMEAWATARRVGAAA